MSRKDQAVSLSNVKANKLRELCNTFRIDVLSVLHDKQTGHIGGSLSVCEILTTLYFDRMQYDPTAPDDPERDRLVLCKGHAAPMLYRVLAEAGFFPVGEMHTLRDIGTRLQGHPCMLKTPGVDMSSGPLGMGLSAALGMAIGLKHRDSKARVYAVIGDGEVEEGVVWETCMAAYKFKADNLCVIMDLNGVQLDGTTDEIMPMIDLRTKFRAFGWHCIECDGHDVCALSDALEQAEQVQGRPTIILAHTVKGKGVSFMEGRNIWHGKAIDDASYERAMKELRGEGK